MTENRNTRSKDSVQATICDRLDAAIQAIVDDNLKPAAIYMTRDDRTALNEHATRLHREATGSTAFLCKLSYEDLLIVSETALGELLEIPVRERQTLSGVRSAVYASNGRPYMLYLP